MEEARAAAMEMAKEEDAPKEKGGQGPKVVQLPGSRTSYWEHGVTRQHRGLQLQV